MWLCARKHEKSRQNAWKKKADWNVKSAWPCDGGPLLRCLVLARGGIQFALRWGCPPRGGWRREVDDEKGWQGCVMRSEVFRDENACISSVSLGMYQFIYRARVRINNRVVRVRDEGDNARCLTPPLVHRALAFPDTFVLVFKLIKVVFLLRHMLGAD